LEEAEATAAGLGQRREALAASVAELDGELEAAQRAVAASDAGAAAAAAAAAAGGVDLAAVATTLCGLQTLLSAAPTAAANGQGIALLESINAQVVAMGAAFPAAQALRAAAATPAAAAEPAAAAAPAAAPPAAPRTPIGSAQQQLHGGAAVPVPEGLQAAFFSALSWKRGPRRPASRTVGGRGNGRLDGVDFEVVRGVGRIWSRTTARHGDRAANFWNCAVQACRLSQRRSFASMGMKFDALKGGQPGTAGMRLFRRADVLSLGGRPLESGFSSGATSA